MSNFSEKSGIVPCTTSWGRWWQSVYEVYIDVHLPEGTKAAQVEVKIQSKHLKIRVKEEIIIEGELCYPVISDETVWTIEEKKLLHIQLTKVDPMSEGKIWTSLLRNQFAADPLTLHEMETKIDLEKFQIENPGLDFSGAKLSKSH